MTVISKLLNRVPDSSLETWHHYDTATDETRIETKQQCDHIIDMNHAEATEPGLKQFGIRKGWWHVARIPNIVIHKWLVEYGVNVHDPNHIDKVRQLVMGDYKKLKTTTGKI